MNTIYTNILLIVSVSVILGAAVSFDLKTQKIPNRLIAAGFLWGAFLRLFSGGLTAMLAAFFRAGVTMVGLFLLFSIGALGAGDVKLISALAVFLRLPTERYVILYSVLAGAAIGFLRLLQKRQLSFRLFRLKTYVMDCCIQRELIPYRQGEKIHFSICIAVGWVLALLQTIRRGEVL